ncbi:cupin domain-containing protein [Streptosporangium sp. NPDC050855]|uniref:cupin domain-containing protein n=1 Tax=Streptosporangium sp. NPDC050855 TaxID=3366194 RepID=UPI0037875AEE
MEYLSPESAPIQTFKMTFAPSSEPIQTRSHEGYEWCYVLQGRARIVLGDREVIVEEGHAAEFDTRIPHGVAALGGQPLEVLSIFNRDGSPPSRHRPPVLPRAGPADEDDGPAVRDREGDAAQHLGPVGGVAEVHVLEDHVRARCGRGTGGGREHLGRSGDQAVDAGRRRTESPGDEKIGARRVAEPFRRSGPRR